jgi:hypothetical protein
MQLKFKIIETPDEILAVSEEEIKEGDWFIHVKSKRLYRCRLSDIQLVRLENCKKIVAYQRKGNKPELDLPLLPEMVNKTFTTEDRIYCVDVQNYEFDTAPQTWDDEKFMSEAEIQGNVYSLKGFVKAFNKTEINQDNLIIRLVKTNMVVEDDVQALEDIQALADKHTKNLLLTSEGRTQRWWGFIEGYRAATKVYSEEDLRQAVELIKKSCYPVSKLFSDEVIVKHNFTIDEIIQSLKQPKTPKYFIAEMVQKSINGSIPVNQDWEYEFKTTTIDGKTYLVGKYLNE